ncbi:FG-GAP repeat protein [Streptomyces sp. NPDC088760]|uniref:FG-GAP repeat protein n=1 Tax=Streptomyces sp. NPDC088760 TaxID=3365890 RepID=UPI0037F847CA
MNRDGYADLLVGSEGDASGTGSVTVLWGGAAPFRSASRCPRDRRIPAACSAPASLWVTSPATSARTSPSAARLRHVHPHQSPSGD